MGYDKAQVLPPKCRVYVEWSREISIVSQISILKKLFPHIKKIGNLQLLRLAKMQEEWLIDEMYVSEAQELIRLAKAQKVVLRMEEVIDTGERQGADI